MNKHEVLNLMTLEEKVLLLQAKDGWDAAAHKIFCENPCGEY